MAKKIPDDCMPACKTCSFFLIETKDDLGFCRRYPPTLIKINGDLDSLFPVVEDSDWCGEFHRFSN